MKALLEQYASYHLWADERLFQTILALPEAQQQQVVTGSFPSLHLTLLHLFDACSVWWQRVRKSETITWPGRSFQGTTADVIRQILQQDKVWKLWVEEAGEAALSEVLYYEDSRKNKFAQPVFEILMQVFNHGTYHRGQIVTTLRLLGIEIIPATDFIVFTRTKG